ncbi:MAG: hypothetical protein P4L61_01430 [Candidatus Pacebacteria bacterium]|nr:hypothetical protein [Candidatus Paceibacterota bacterium]
MLRKVSYSIIIIAILAVLGGFAYFFFYLNKPAPKGESTMTSQNPFNPLNTSGASATQGQSSNMANSTSSAIYNNSGQIYQFPKIREIWPTPVGGFVASTTGGTAFVRFVDRGTGYVYDMSATSSMPVNISNTTVPLVYGTYWNGNGMSGIFRYIKEGSDDVTNFYVQLRSTATTTTESNGTSTVNIPTTPIISQTPYMLRGMYFPGNIISAAVSPKDNQIFTVESVSGNGVGYISNFDGSGSSRIFSTPLTQVDAFWPIASTLMLATKSSEGSYGYLYSIDVKTGGMSEIIGGLIGLSVLPNTTGQLVLYSDVSSSGNLVTSLFDMKNGSSQDLPFVTLADKCVWSRQNPLDVFCAVPSPTPTDYPDAWYKGTDPSTDLIVEIDTDTGSVHPISNLTTDAKTQIDAEQLALDPSERFLYFINKRDLSLWSVDLDQ